MNIRTQITVALVIIICTISLVIMVRKRNVQVKYSLMWFMLMSCIIILDIFPEILAESAAFLGVEVPINMLFFFGFVISLLLIFILTLTVSHQSLKIKALTQHVGLLEHEMEKLKKNSR